MVKKNDTISFLVAPKTTMLLWIIEGINKGLATSFNKGYEENQK